MVIDWDGKRIILHSLTVRVLLILTLTQLMFSGNFDDDLNFNFGDGATVYKGCGAMLMDQFWYFGGSGSANNRQVNRNIILSQHVSHMM